MSETATPKRRRVAPETPGAPPTAPGEEPLVAPETAPDKPPHPHLGRRTRHGRCANCACRGRRRKAHKHDDNPLREGLRLERVPDPHVSSCSARPATSPTARSCRPSTSCGGRTCCRTSSSLLAIGRRAYDDDTLRAEFRASLEKYSRVLPLDEAAWRSFADADPLPALRLRRPRRLRRARQRRSRRSTASRTRRGNHLFYLATQPSAFAEIVAQLGRVGLDHERHDGGWRRIVIEKPFGHDLDSAIRLNREVGKVFRETQVYRIDHYLGKETVRNLLVFRFGNGIFEPIWNRRYIDHVQITVAESIGVENRGAFYEETGASRDFLQNHLLQLLSLVAMEPPATFEADALRDEKVKVIRAIGEMTPDKVRARRRPRPVRPGLGRRQAGPRATARSRRSTRSRRPRRSSPPASRSTTGAGRASRSTSAPASGCRSGRPRSRSSSRRSPTGSSATRRPSPSRTSSRSGSSRTRGSCSASGRRCRASGSTSAR